MRLSPDAIELATREDLQAEIDKRYQLQNSAVKALLAATKITQKTISSEPAMSKKSE